MFRRCSSRLRAVVVAFVLLAPITRLRTHWWSFVPTRRFRPATPCRLARPGSIRPLVSGGRPARRGLLIMLLVALAIAAAAASPTKFSGAHELVAPAVEGHRKLVAAGFGGIGGDKSPPPPSPPPSPPPPPPNAPPPPITVESRLPSVKTTGVPGAAARIGAPGTVGGVSQVKAYTASRRRALSTTTAPDSIAAKCTSTSPAGCVTRTQPDYDLINQAKPLMLVQVDASLL